jgi:hypothetical protein
MSDECEDRALKARRFLTSVETTSALGSLSKSFAIVGGTGPCMVRETKRVLTGGAPPRPNSTPCTKRQR